MYNEYMLSLLSFDFSALFFRRRRRICCRLLPFVALRRYVDKTATPKWLLAATVYLLLLSQIDFIAIYALFMSIIMSKLFLYVHNPHTRPISIGIYKNEWGGKNNNTFNMHIRWKSFEKCYIYSDCLSVCFQ